MACSSEPTQITRTNFNNCRIHQYVICALLLSLTPISLFQLGLTSYKANRPQLQCLELKEKGEEKEENHMRKLTKKNRKIKDA